jgi:putative salt-induced outer membrane protein YdiY
MAQDNEIEEKKVGWFNSTDLSFVFTEGNSNTDSIGFKNTLSHKWERSDFRLQVDSTLANTADDPFLLVEPGLTFLPGETITGFTTTEVRPAKEPDIEKYFLEGRYRHRLGEKRVWNAGGSWDRNEDAGILNRYIVFGGHGNLLKQGERLNVETSFGASYTYREEETPDPEKESQFFGFRTTFNLGYKMLKATTLDYQLTGNLNLEDMSDYSLDTTGSLAVSLSNHLDLRVSLQFQFNSEPALEDVDVLARLELIDPDGTPGNGDEYFVTVTEGGYAVEIGEDQIRKQELDTVFRTSLVINF